MFLLCTFDVGPPGKHLHVYLSAPNALHGEAGRYVVGIFDVSIEICFLDARPKYIVMLVFSRLHRLWISFTISNLNISGNVPKT